MESTKHVRVAVHTMEVQPPTEYTSARLKGLCRERNLSFVGTKAELISRLYRENPDVCEALEEQKNANDAARRQIERTDAEEAASAAAEETVSRGANQEAARRRVYGEHQGDGNRALVQRELELLH